MKAYLIIAAGWLMTSPAGAQQPERLLNNHNVSQLAFASPSSHGFQTFSNREPNVEGSPYYAEEWLLCRIQLPGQDTFSQWLGAAMDIVNDQLYLQMEDDFISKFPMSMVGLMEVVDGKDTLLFQVRDLSEEFGSGQKRYKFYEVIHDGKYTLFKCHSKFLRLESYVENLGMVRRPNKYMPLYSYWLIADGTLRQAGASVNAMKKAFPEKARQIDQYVKSKKLKLSDKKDLSLLMQLLDK